MSYICLEIQLKKRKSHTCFLASVNMSSRVIFPRNFMILLSSHCYSVFLYNFLKLSCSVVWSQVINCHDSVIYILAPLRYATIYGCSDATIVLGAVGKVTTVFYCYWRLIYGSLISASCTLFVLCEHAKAKNFALVVWHWTWKIKICWIILAKITVSP